MLFDLVAGFGINISDMVNRSRGAWAVSALDLDGVPAGTADTLIAAVQKVPGMRRVRLLLPEAQI